MAHYGNGAQWEWYTVEIRINTNGAQRAWYTVGIYTNTKWERYTMGMVLYGNGTQWEWYTMVMVHNGNGTQWEWHTMGMVHNDPGHREPTSCLPKPSDENRIRADARYVHELQSKQKHCIHTILTCSIRLRKLQKENITRKVFIGTTITVYLAPILIITTTTTTNFSLSLTVRKHCEKSVR